MTALPPALGFVTRLVILVLDAEMLLRGAARRDSRRCSASHRS